MAEVICTLVWVSNFVLLVYMYVFLIVLYYFNYYGSVINLEIWNGNSTFSQDFSICSLLWFHMNFWIGFSTSVMNERGNLTGFVLNL